MEAAGGAVTGTEAAARGVVAEVVEGVAGAAGAAGPAGVGVEDRLLLAIIIAEGPGAAGGPGGVQHRTTTTAAGHPGGMGGVGQGLTGPQEGLGAQVDVHSPKLASTCSAARLLW